LAAFEFEFDVGAFGEDGDDAGVAFGEHGSEGVGADWGEAVRRFWRLACGDGEVKPVAHFLDKLRAWFFFKGRGEGIELETREGVYIRVYEYII